MFLDNCNNRYANTLLDLLIFRKFQPIHLGEGVHTFEQHALHTMVFLILMPYVTGLEIFLPTNRASKSWSR